MRWRAPTGVLLLAAALLAGANLAPHADRAHVAGLAQSGCSSRVSADSVKCEINAIRRAHGLAQLTTSHRLRRAARRHAADMVRRRYFGHVSPEGKTLADRARAARYVTHRQNWALGEDIAWGTGAQATPKAIVAAWMASPPHRAVILNKVYRNGGAGIVAGTPTGAGGGYTYVMDLGRNRKAPSGSRISGWQDGEAF